MTSTRTISSTEPDPQEALTSAGYHWCSDDDCDGDDLLASTTQPHTPHGQGGTRRSSKSEPAAGAHVDILAEVLWPELVSLLWPCDFGQMANLCGYFLL